MYRNHDRLVGGRAALQYHSERNHQGKGNLLLFPSPDGALSPKRRVVSCRERLGGLLRYYSRAA